MTKKIALTVSMILCIHVLFGQSFIVREVKKCTHTDGRKIKKGDTLDLASNFIVSKKGTINLQHANGWVMQYSAPVSYKLDSLFGKVKISPEFITHDSLFNILSSNNVEKCNFPYKFDCTPIFNGIAFGTATSIADNIKTPNRRIETFENTVMLKWMYPVPYDGKFYLIIKNMFEDYIDLKVVQGDSFLLDLTPYKKHGGILYRITSEECRETDDQIIVMK